MHICHNQVMTVETVVQVRARWVRSSSGFHIYRQVDNAGDDDEGPSYKRHYSEHLGHTSQPHCPIQVPLLQTVFGHDGVDEANNVNGPHRAEAGQHRKQKVVFHLGPVQRGVGGDARVAR